MDQILEDINTKVEVFTDGKDTYIYDITLIKAWQTACAEEAVRTRNDVMKNPKTKDVHTMIKSGATAWLLQTGAFLLRKRNSDGTIDKFNEDKAMGEVLDFVKELSKEDVERLGVCIENFFSGSIAYSELLKMNLGIKNENETEMSSQQVLTAMIQAIYNNNSSNRGL